MWKHFYMRLNFIINYYLHLYRRFCSEMPFHKRSWVKLAKVQKYFCTISFWTAALKFSFTKCLSFHSLFRTDWNAHKIPNIYTTKFYGRTIYARFFRNVPSGIKSSTTISYLVYAFYISLSICQNWTYI